MQKEICTHTWKYFMTLKATDKQNLMGDYLAYGEQNTNLVLANLKKK